MTWNFGRQLASFDDIAYTYNEEGIRTSKTSNGVTTKYYLNDTKIIEQTDGITTLHFYYDSKDEIVGFNYNGADYFYVKNALGDITDITNSSGEIIASYEYDPWGQVLSVTGSNVEIGELNPFRYRSYYYDSDIEMYYLQSRYYDPEICRFINSDNVSFIGVSDTEIGYNPFAYCENNPVNDSDPNGTRVYAIGLQLDLYAIFGASFSIQLVWDSNGDVGILVFAAVGGGWSIALSAVAKVYSKYDTIYQLKGISRSISLSGSIQFVSIGGTYSKDNSGKYIIYVNAGITAPIGPVGGSACYGGADLIYLFNYKKGNVFKNVFNVLKAFKNIQIVAKYRGKTCVARKRR